LYNAADLKLHARIRKWKDTDAAEIRVFLAIMVYMGIIRKPDARMFWTTNPLLATPFVRDVMSVNRFSLLERCLHFADNTVPPLPTASDTEKILWKINPFLEPLISNFSAVYTPDRFIAVDESLMLWKGKLGIKQYIHTKRVRWGLKSYELCEVGSGYIWTAFVHTGRADQINLVPSTDDRTSSRIVLTLMRGLLGLGYHVYMDSFFSSPQLCVDLFQQQTDAVGTVRVSRSGMPPSFGSKTGAGATCVRFSGNVMALKWHDRKGKPVCMLSTVHDRATTTIRTYRGESERPTVVCDYNASLGVVDIADQMLVAYPMGGQRKTVWYKKFFRHLISQAVLNAYIIHSKMATRKLSHLDFRIGLVTKIIEVILHLVI